MTTGCLAPASLPGLVLVLDEPVAGGPALRFLEVLRRLVDPAPQVVVHHLADLRRHGVISDDRGPLAAVTRRRWLGAQATSVLRLTERQSRASQLVVFIVGFLAGTAARRHTAGLLHDVGDALRDVAILGASAPAVVAINVLPERWSPFEGAELHAWRCELEHVTRRGYADAPLPGQCAGAFVLGRGQLANWRAAGTLALSDTEIATTAAHFTAACLQFRVADWLRSTRRGTPHRSPIAAVGIAPLPAEHGNIQSVVDASGVLWPGAADPSELGVGDGACAVAARAVVPPLRDWEHVLPVAPDSSPGAGWLLRVQHGLNTVDIAGAAEWRRQYEVLPPEQRSRLHHFPAVAASPEPVHASAGPAAELYPPFTLSL